LKKIVLLLAALCCATFGLFNFCMASPEDAATNAEEEVIAYDSGIPTNLSNTSPLGIVAEVVRFTPPSEPWILSKVQIGGWDGFDNVTLPSERTVYLEIRDDDFNLLYQFADSQIPYFTSTGIVLTEIEVPPIMVEGDFYICFYDRGAVGVAYDDTDPSGRSYWYDRYTRDLSPAGTVLEGSEEIAPINWIIRAVGH
jgi:hypothetical protein